MCLHQYYGTPDADTGYEYSHMINSDYDGMVINAGAGNDLIYGSADWDTLYGEAGNDTIYAGDSADMLYGGSGNDNLYGENGNDRLDGGDGMDFLNGGAGDDYMLGGQMNDTYRTFFGDTLVDQSGASDAAVVKWLQGGTGGEDISDPGTGGDRVLFSLTDAPGEIGIGYNFTETLDEDGYFDDLSITNNNAATPGELTIINQFTLDGMIEEIDIGFYRDNDSMATVHFNELDVMDMYNIVGQMSAYAAEGGMNETQLTGLAEIINSNAIDKVSVTYSS